MKKIILIIICMVGFGGFCSYSNAESKQIDVSQKVFSKILENPKSKDQKYIKQIIKSLQLNYIQESYPGNKQDLSNTINKLEEYNLFLDIKYNLHNYILDKFFVKKLDKLLKQNPKKLTEYKELLNKSLIASNSNPKIYIKLLAINEYVDKNIIDITKNTVFDYDFKTDSSIYKYVNNKISLNNKEYEPNDLTKLTGENLIDMKGNIKIRTIALENLNNMLDDYQKIYFEKMPIISAYRSFEYQSGVFARRTKIYGSELEASKRSAKPGYSEHQLGLAIDFWDIDIGYTDLVNYYSGAIVNNQILNNNLTGAIYTKRYEHFRRLENNAHKYGFTNSYQNGIEIDGYNIEPWHWRYVGVQLATYLHNKGITLGQYFTQNNIFNEK